MRSLEPRQSVCLTALGVLLAVSPSLSRAQGGAPPPLVDLVPAPQQGAVGYSVTGRMVCADTQKAARFAQVTLISASSQDGNFGPGRRAFARTDLDGNFTIANVSPGDYYVTGALPGYVNQAQLVQTTLNSGADPGAALAGVPFIHVSAGGASTLLSLQRGGVVAGTVQWDDGTPAAGVNVAALLAPTVSTPGSTSQGARYLGGFGGNQTDDRGRFRLSGLTPGSYFVSASVQAPAPQRPGDRGYSRTLSLNVYAPNKVRRSDATPIAVGSGEERNDLSLTIGLAGMHTVSGIVSASAAAVRSGSASLTDQTDSSLSRNSGIASDGSFVIPYVPPGTYTLRINASSQQPSFNRGGATSTDTTRFQPLQQSITVTDSDLSGLAITVTPATTQ